MNQVRFKNNDKIYFILLFLFMIIFMYFQDNTLYTKYIKYATIVYFIGYLVTRIKYRVVIPNYVIGIGVYFIFTYTSAILQGYIFSNNTLGNVRIPQYIITFIIIYELLRRCKNPKIVFYLSWIICITVSDIIIFKDFIFSTYKTSRFFGLFATSSMTSIFSSISLIFIIDLIVNKNIFKKRQKIVLIICGIFNIISVFAQGSKTGILHILLVIIIYMLRKKYTYKKLLYTTISIVLLSIILVNFVMYGQSLIANRIRESLSFQDASTIERVNLWKIGIQMFLEKPIAGWGYLNEMNFLPNYGYATGLGFHSQVLKTLIEGGIFAFFLYYGLLIKLLFNLRNNKGSFIFEIWAGIILLTFTMSSTLERGWFWFILTLVSIEGRNVRK